MLRDGASAGRGGWPRGGALRRVAAQAAGGPEVGAWCGPLQGLRLARCGGRRRMGALRDAAAPGFGGSLGGRAPRRMPAQVAGRKRGCGSGGKRPRLDFALGCGGCALAGCCAREWSMERRCGMPQQMGSVEGCAAERCGSWRRGSRDESRGAGAVSCGLVSAGCRGWAWLREKGRCRVRVPGRAEGEGAEAIGRRRLRGDNWGAAAGWGFAWVRVRGGACASWRSAMRRIGGERRGRRRMQRSGPDPGEGPRPATCGGVGGREP